MLRITFSFIDPTTEVRYFFTKDIPRAFNYEHYAAQRGWSVVSVDDGSAEATRGVDD